MRYHTPVGPIRLDFSYNLNPPIYPVNVNYSQSDYLRQPACGRGGALQLLFQPGADILMVIQRTIPCESARAAMQVVCVAAMLAGAICCCRRKLATKVTAHGEERYV